MIFLGDLNGWGADQPNIKHFWWLYMIFFEKLVVSAFEHDSGNISFDMIILVFEILPHLAFLNDDFTY